MGLYLLPWISVLDIISLCFGLKSLSAYFFFFNLDKLAWYYDNQVTFCFAAETPSTAPGCMCLMVPLLRVPTVVVSECCLSPFGPWAWCTGLPHDLEMLSQPQLQNLCYTEALFKNNSTVPLFSCKHFSKRQFEVCQGLLTEIRQIFHNKFSKYLERILSGKRDWLLVSKIIIFQKQNASVI